jgi:Zn-dependent protease with chaperone function
VSIYLAAALGAYAVLMGVLADRMLTRATWTSGSPTLALRAWHTCALACLSAIICASAVLAHDPWDHLMVWLFHASEPRVHATYAWSAEVAPWWNGTIGIVLLLGTVLLVSGANHFRELRRTRAAHRLIAGKATEVDGLAGVYVLPSSRAAAYCVPGRRTEARIVVTSGAVQLLSAAELRAAVEHERAHLRYRHHRGVLWSSLITQAMSRSGLLRNYAGQVRRLSEMAADDQAAARVGPRHVATALLTLCVVTPPPGGSMALPMAGSHAAERIRRLVATKTRPVVRLNRLLSVGSAAALILLPLALVLGPAMALAGTHHG